MPAPADPRVAVYIDFDNIVISRYDQTHGREAWRNDRVRSTNTQLTRDRLVQAVVDFGAILDYASSFGTIVISRAYADWSVGANANYRQQLIDRAVDLTQLFPVSGHSKNGADIRLSVDVVEDLFRLPDISHVVIVAGDSDYIALAQRARRLGRYVVGIGIDGSTSSALKSACDQFAVYDDLLDIEDEGDENLLAPALVQHTPAAESAQPRRGGRGAEAPAVAAAEPAVAEEPEVGVSSDRLTPKAASRLLVRAMRLIRDKQPDDEWMSMGEVKNQMMRMNPSFTERQLGFASFRDFVAERNSQVEISKAGQGQPRIRLRSGQ